MLRYMHSRAEEELAAAESALIEAESAYQGSRTSLNAAQVILANSQRRDKEEDMKWQKKTVDVGQPRHRGDGQSDGTP